MPQGPQAHREMFLKKKDNRCRTGGGSAAGGSDGEEAQGQEEGEGRGTFKDNASSLFQVGNAFPLLLRETETSLRLRKDRPDALPQAFALLLRKC